MVHTGQESRPRNPAHIFAVEIIEAKAALSQLIQVRCADLTAKTAEVGVTHVIGHDDDNIRRRRIGCRRDRQQQAETAPAAAPCQRFPEPLHHAMLPLAVAVSVAPQLQSFL